jgi:hypothetical protein
MASSATARAHVAVDDWRRLGDQLPNRALNATGSLPLQPGTPTDLALLVESAARAALAPSARTAAASR